jgi:hypothetical protein
MNAIQSNRSSQRINGQPDFLEHSLKIRLIQTVRRLKKMSPHELASFRGVTEYHMRVLLRPNNKIFIYWHLLPFVYKDKKVEFYDKLSGYSIPQNSIQQQTAYIYKVRVEFSEWLKRFVNDKWISTIYSSN